MDFGKIGTKPYKKEIMETKSYKLSTLFILRATKKPNAISVLSLTENTLKLSLPFGQVKLSAIVKFGVNTPSEVSPTAKLWK